MSFADPLIVTINAVAKSLPRVEFDKRTSTYFLRESTQEFLVRIRNTSYQDAVGATIDRHNMELTQTVYAVAPATKPTVRKIYTTFDNARSDTDASLNQTLLGFAGLLTAGNFTKLLAGES